MPKPTPRQKPLILSERRKTPDEIASIIRRFYDNHKKGFIISKDAIREIAMRERLEDTVILNIICAASENYGLIITPFGETQRRIMDQFVVQKRSVLSNKYMRYDDIKEIANVRTIPIRRKVSR